MSILVGLRHATRYGYDRPISLGPQIVRLRPAPHCRTRIVSYALAVRPAQRVMNWQQDPYGNWLARYVFAEKTREFVVTVDLAADLAPINPFEFLVEPYAESWPFQFSPEMQAELIPFLAGEPAGPRLADFIASISRAPRSTIDFLVDLNQQLHRSVRYVVRLESGVQTPEETLASGIGSCRDTAWLFVQILRHIGLPSRFVSGYLVQLRPDVKPLPGTADPEHDAAALHAWAEAYLPGAGWIGLDPTSGLLCSEAHIPLAAAPHFRTAAPITGTVEPSAVKFAHDISIERIADQPRINA